MKWQSASPTPHQPATEEALLEVMAQGQGRVGLQKAPQVPPFVFAQSSGWREQQPAQGRGSYLGRRTGESSPGVDSRSGLPLGAGVAQREQLAVQLPGVVATLSPAPAQVVKVWSHLLRPRSVPLIDRRALPLQVLAHGLAVYPHYPGDGPGRQPPAAGLLDRLPTGLLQGRGLGHPRSLSYVSGGCGGLLRWRARICSLRGGPAAGAQETLEDIAHVADEVEVVGHLQGVALVGVHPLWLHHESRKNCRGLSHEF